MNVKCLPKCWTPASRAWNPNCWTPALSSLKPTTNLLSYKMLDAHPLEPETHNQPPIIQNAGRSPSRAWNPQPTSHHAGRPPLEPKPHKQPPIIWVVRYLTRASPQPVTLHERLAQLSRNDPACFLTIIAPSSPPTRFPPGTVSCGYSPRGSCFIISSGLCLCNSLCLEESVGLSEVKENILKLVFTCVYLE